MHSEYDVIIVGGGAAGIGAARRLAANDASALLLEVSSRLGGRAFTQDLGGYPLDLGCEWLHSGDRNAWVGIAEASGFRSTAAMRRGLSRIPASPGTRTTSRRPGGRSAVGRSGSARSRVAATGQATPWSPAAPGTLMCGPSPAS